MNSLSTSLPAAILIAALAAALLFHLSRLLGPLRLVHAAFAAAAMGLIYLMGAAAFGWAFDGQGALLWVYLALFILAGAMAARRRATLGAIGLPWLSALIQLGVVAYMFAPDWFRKPPATAALAVYFLFEALVWLRGRETEDPAAPTAEKTRERPPLFAPQRRRGFAEVSAAAAAVAIVYLLAVGPHAANVDSEAATAEEQESQVEPTDATETASAQEPAPATNAAAPNEASKADSAESQPADAAPQAAESAPEEAPPKAESAESQAADAAPPVAESAPEEAPPKVEGAEGEAATPVQQATAGAPAAPPAPLAAKEPETYTARAGDTFKSIAKRLYGSTSKWREIAKANPGVKRKKLRAGEVVYLPSAPTR